MCGIAGILRFAGEGRDATSVERMLGRLTRRGPDDGGIEVFERAVIGNRRLAILDLSPAGHQPMRSRDGRLVITFNGEIYNHEDLRRELGVDPGELRSRSDTEILLRAWERWGEEALPRLVGQWAFAIFDTGAGTLWLARDRFGEKPLFYHSNARRLAFASSLGALLEEPETPRELSPEAVTEYLTLGYVVSPRTVLREVRKLQGGCLLEVGAGGATRERTWFVPRFRAPRGGAAASRVARDEEFDARFTRACARTLVSDVTVALLLSDGIDSNSVRVALAGQRPAPISYTFRLRDSDSGIPPAPPPSGAGEIVDIEVSPLEQLGQMDCFFSALTEPVGDFAALATWMLIRGARGRATVFLCGHGGDELLGGYRLSQDRFRLAALRRAAAIPGPWLGAPLARFLYGDEPPAERRAAFHRAGPGMAPAAARYLIHRPLPPEQLRRLLGGALPAGERYLATIDRLYADCSASSADLDRMQEVMLRTFLSENILSFADSVAMDSSCELRMPFLDRDLADYVLSLPAEERVGRWPGRTNTKLPLRHWAESRMPRDIVRRRKRPFQAGQVSELLRKDADGIRRRVLDSPAIRRALPGAEDWVTSVLSDDGDGCLHGAMWRVLVLGAWCDAWEVR
jgi:asparagine synthase (glutamine-hydrolysing)